MANLSKYWSSEFSDVEDVPVSGSGVGKMGDKRRNKDMEIKHVKKRKTGVKIDGLTVTQHKRMLGDQVKDKLMIAGGRGNWHIKAQCQVISNMSTQAFKAVVIPHAASVTPDIFDKNTEVVEDDEDFDNFVNFIKVVLVELKNMEQASAIFGCTKLRKGTRMGGWEVNTMDIVFKPRLEELRIWWTMKDDN